MRVPDPNNKNESMVKNGKKFSNYQKRGYIFNEQDNSFVKPSKKTKEAFESAAQSHELKIIDKNDPIIQMERLKNVIQY